jgi:hypothetical protein
LDCIYSAHKRREQKARAKLAPGEPQIVQPLLAVAPPVLPIAIPVKPGHGRPKSFSGKQAFCLQSVTIGGGGKLQQPRQALELRSLQQAPF